MKILRFDDLYKSLVRCKLSRLQKYTLHIILIIFIKLNFKSAEKTIKQKNPKHFFTFIFSYNFFPIYKKVGWILSRKKGNLQKRLVKDIKIFLKTKTKSVNVLINDAEVFLKKRLKPQKYSRERYKNHPDDKNQRLVDYGKIVLRCRKIRQLHKLRLIDAFWLCKIFFQKNP